MTTKENIVTCNFFNARIGIALHQEVFSVSRSMSITLLLSDDSKSSYRNGG